MWLNEIHPTCNPPLQGEDVVFYLNSNMDGFSKPRIGNLYLLKVKGGRL
jgi:hypothetical protein